MISERKRLLAAVTSLAALSIALSGCGSSGASNSSSESESSKSDEKVQITYLHRLPDKPNMTPVNDIVARWNKSHPNIQVKATKFNGKSAEMIKKLETDVKAGNAPDLAQVGYAELPEVYTKSMLEDVSDEASQYKSNFSPGAYKLMGIDGKMFGLPQDTGPLVYFYNKAEFDKLGISVPTSKDELIETAKKTAAQGKYIMSYQPDEAGNMMPGLAGATKPWYTVKNDAWVVDTQTDGSKQVADVYQQLLDAKAAPTNPRWDPSFDASLKNGQLIGTVGSAWEAPLIVDTMGDTGKGEWRVAQLGDWFGNSGKSSPDGGSGVAVLKGSKHPEQAMEFLNWFNTQVKDLTSQGLVLAATTEEAKTPESWSSYFGDQDLMKEFATANKNMGDFTYMPGFSSVAAAMTETAAKAATGQAKVADIFSQAQTTSIATLKDYGLAVAK